MAEPSRWRPGLSTQVLLGLVLGIAAGVFFGEATQSLQVVADAFILLLQMTVLPYVVTSLAAGLGHLDLRDARRLAIGAGGVLLALWSLGLGLVLLMPFAFPNWTSASFFSEALIEQREPLDFLRLYIPANPFRSLSESVVPAVVVFTVAFGVALMGLPDKRRIVDALATMADALMRITQFVVRLAPLGVFAISAKASGTLEVDEFGRLQIFVLAHASLSLILAFYLLPGLVAALTPLSYRGIVAAVRTPLVTAFATGSLLIVLPMLADKIKRLLAESGEEAEEWESSVDVLVPVSFNFPTVGKLLSLGFIPFAGWFAGATVSAGELPSLLGAGLFSFFGQTVMALPFLLDLFRIPADTFQLFVVVDVLTGRFGSMVAAMHTAAFATLGAFAMAGRVRVRWVALGRFVAIGATLALAAVLGIRVLFTHGVGHEYTQYRVFVGMEMQSEAAPSRVFAEEMPAAGSEAPTALERIRERGTLRVGYPRDALPFAFVNSAQRLVGFDIEMAHVLARELGVGLEFVRVERRVGVECLAARACDIVVGGIAVTTDRLRELAFTRSYLDQTIAFVVPDYRRHQFDSRWKVKRLDPLRLGVGDIPYYAAKVREYLPQAEFVTVTTPREFFRGEIDVDAFVFSAEAGSAWSLVYPEFAVAIPHPDVFRVPTAYAVARDDTEWRNLVDTWIELKEKDGTIERLRGYWIEGREARPREPRWSVIRDVLHWVR